MKNSPVERLLDMFLRFHRRLLFAGRQLQFPLSVNESHVLAYILKHTDCTALEAARDLHLEKSTMSRLVGAMQEQECLIVRVATTDRRMKHLRVSDRGQKLLHGHDLVRDKRIRRCLHGLSAKQQADFTVFFRMLAEGFKGVELARFHDVHPCDGEIRRLNVSMGALDADYLGTNVSIERFEVMQLVNASGDGGLPLSRLRVLLPYDPSYLSRLVSSLQEEGLLSRHVHEIDRRHAHIHLSKKGLEYYTRAKKKAVETLSQAVSSQLERHFSECLSLMKTLLGSDDTSHSLDVIDGIRIKLLKTEEERLIGRKFLVEELVKNKQHDHLPESLVAEKSFNVAAYEDNHIKGVIEIKKTKREWEISNFAVFSGLSSRRLPLELMIESLRMLFARRRAASVRLPENSPACHWIEDIFPQRKHDGWVEISEERLEVLEDAMSAIP